MGVSMIRSVGVSITPLASIDARLTRRTWEFSRANARRIDAHWADRTARQPSLFNGDVLLLEHWVVRDGHFSGECIRTDFKSFLYWREHDAPDREVFDFFAAGALHSREGWLILGHAGPTTSNAGKIYPPSGSLHADDQLGNGEIDLDGSIIREIHEETGIQITRAQLGPLLLIEARPQVVIVRPVAIARPAAEIVKQIGDHLRASSSAELAEVVVVRGREDIRTDVMPPFTVAYVEHAFQTSTDRLAESL
jgi:8-oxo-dGTP pyrophosphatase MutT (NUDIX family)